MEEWPTYSIKDVLLFLLAVYGAVLSTFNWRQAVRREKRTINVKMSTAMPTFEDGHVGPCFAMIEATNSGHRTVTITTLALELPTGARMFATTPNSFPGRPDTALPANLSDGQSAYLYLSYQDIAGALIQSGRNERTKVIPVCEDSVGGVYKGNPWEVDPDEFSRM